DLRSRERRLKSISRQQEIVKFIDVAPPPPSKPLRSLVEPIERADVSRMEFDPDQADDVHLVPRSPRLGRRQDAEPAAGSTRRPAPSAPPSQPAPPASAPVQANRIPPPSAPVVAQLPPNTTPPPPAPQQSASADTPPGGSNATEIRSPRGAEGQGTRELGLQVIRSQYLAYVRAKIRKANERIMPRKWIEDVLPDKVSADFEVLVGRGGRILSARLARSTGYSQLDDIAKQAIYIASPFEGYPPDAGDMITLTVTVYYTPWR
ncbi:MAG TPA: TonB C-terminal domain-containing protein, partial [Blastocatellia bacterium]|nr:TonB C-terminal domain-containing protein [Blastocatellia bacterium]